MENDKLYVARDKNGYLVVYFTNDKNSIIKDKKNKCWREIGRIGSMNIPPNLLPEIKWEDEEPTEVEITVK